MRPSRRTQPYRGGRGPAGPARRNMKRGRPAVGSNPMDTKRAMQKLAGRRRKRGRRRAVRRRT